MTYEDLISDPEALLNRCLQWLGLSDQRVKIPPLRFKKTANAHSEAWVQLLYEHLQQKWDKKVLLMDNG